MLTYSSLFVYKQERILRFQRMNQRRNEKLHPDVQYSDHLSMGRAFLERYPKCTPNSLFRASGYFGQPIISLVIEAVKHSPFYI